MKLQAPSTNEILMAQENSNVPSRYPLPENIVENAKFVNPMSNSQDVHPKIHPETPQN